MSPDNLLVKAYAALLLIAAGCSAPEEGEPAIVFTPDAKLATQTKTWAERWSKATGVDIRVGEGGIQVRAVDAVTISDEDTCGATLHVLDRQNGEHLRSDLVEIDTTPPKGCVGWGYTLGHEIGHALGAVGHTEDGLMQPTLPLGVVHVIDDAALELVCANLDCAWMTPEVSP